MKQHLLRGYRNATCKQCLVHVKEEIKVYKSKKKEVKEQRNLTQDAAVIEANNKRTMWNNL